MKVSFVRVGALKDDTVRVRSTALAPGDQADQHGAAHARQDVLALRRIENERCAPESRRIRKHLPRQWLFWARLRTILRNRIHAVLRDERDTGISQEYDAQKRSRQDLTQKHPLNVQIKATLASSVVYCCYSVELATTSWRCLSEIMGAARARRSSSACASARVQCDLKGRLAIASRTLRCR